MYQTLVGTRHARVTLYWMTIYGPCSRYYELTCLRHLDACCSLLGLFRTYQPFLQRHKAILYSQTKSVHERYQIRPMNRPNAWCIRGGGLVVSTAPKASTLRHRIAAVTLVASPYHDRGSESASIHDRQRQVLRTHSTRFQLVAARSHMMQATRHTCQGSCRPCERCVRVNLRPLP